MKEIMDNDDPDGTLLLSWLDVSSFYTIVL